MCSTYYNNATKKIRRIAKGNVTEEITKPHMISEYTANMGGVDKADHYCSSYAFIQKSLKWWRKLYFFLLEVAVVNSFILYKIHMESLGQKKLTHRNFRKALCEQLVSDIRVKLSAKRTVVNEHDVPDRLNGTMHMVNIIQDNRTRDCAVCSDRYGPGGRKTTVYCCETCPGKPGLHPKNCFMLYHSKVDYKIRYNN